MTLSRGSFDYHSWREDSYWNVVGQGQGCCLDPTLHSADPNNKECLVQIVLRLRNSDLAYSNTH